MSGDPIVFFRRDSLVFLVSHPGVSIKELNQSAVLGWANQKAQQLFDPKIEAFKLNAEIPGCTFAIDGLKAVENVNKPATTQSDLLSEVGAVVDRLRHGDARGAWQYILSELHPSTRVKAEVVAPSSFSIFFPTVENLKMDELVRLGKALDDGRAEFNKLEAMQGKFTLDQVALHWYNSAGNDGLGSGGPGSQPTLHTGAMSDPHPFSLPSTLTPSLGGAGKAVVKVAILDTAPTEDALRRAFTVMGSPTPPHPLVKGMLGTPRKLTVEPRDVLDRLDNVCIEGHDYDMSDHGSFVAGIIHSIAPFADLHLWRVLNDHGVADTQSIATGLCSVFTQVFADMRDHGPKWVINASLMMTAPTDDVHLLNLLHSLKGSLPNLSAPDEKEQQDLYDLLMGGPTGAYKDIQDWLKTRQTDAVEYMCYMLSAYLRTPVIAAAGNDRQGLKRPQPGARYPARADSAVGVGALQDQISPAPYSNTADQPASVGIVTFGGDRSATEVLGLYIGNDPAGHLSKTGWARWSGTSFATPIVSGIATAFVSTGAYATTQDAINDLFAKTRLTGSPNSDRLVITQS